MHLSSAAARKGVGRTVDAGKPREAEWPARSSAAFAEETAAISKGSSINYVTQSLRSDVTNTLLCGSFPARVLRSCRIAGHS